MQVIALVDGGQALLRIRLRTLLSSGVRELSRRLAGGKRCGTFAPKLLCLFGMQCLLLRLNVNEFYVKYEYCIGRYVFSYGTVSIG